MDWDFESDISAPVSPKFSRTFAVRGRPRGHGSFIGQRQSSVIVSIGDHVSPTLSAWQQLEEHQRAKILQNILQYCKDNLNCRLVCVNWKLTFDSMHNIQLDLYHEEFDKDQSTNETISDIEDESEQSEETTPRENDEGHLNINLKIVSKSTPTVSLFSASSPTQRSLIRSVWNPIAKVDSPRRQQFLLNRSQSGILNMNAPKQTQEIFNEHVSKVISEEPIRNAILENFQMTAMGCIINSGLSITEKCKLKTTIPLLEILNKFYSEDDKEHNVAVSYIMNRLFVTRKWLIWTNNDQDGSIFGWSEKVILYILKATEDNEEVVLDIWPNLSLAQYSIFRKKLSYYAKKTGKKTKNAQIICVTVTDDARTMIAKHSDVTLMMLL